MAKMIRQQEYGSYFPYLLRFWSCGSPLRFHFRRRREVHSAAAMGVPC